MREQFSGKVVIKTIRTVLDMFLKVQAVSIAFEGFDGRQVEPLYELLYLERDKAVAALVHDIENATLILVEQFRFPTYKKSGGWVFEIVAGMVDEDEYPRDAILREILEETGYEAEVAIPITEFYVSPGASDETIALYYVPVHPKHERHAGGGLAHESEQVRRVAIGAKEVLEMLDAGAFIDAKTIIALQWFRNEIIEGTISDFQ